MRENSINAEHHHTARPLCPCCGGDRRKGYKYTKAKSRAMSDKSRKSKPKSKDHK